MSDVSRILAAIDHGDPPAADELLPLVYSELRQLAAARMHDERTGHTRGAIALVHEAYLRLVEGERRSPASQKKPGLWNSRGHFVSAAVEAMRRILIEHARKLRAAKRGGRARRVDVDPPEPFGPARAEEPIALDESLDRLEEADAEAARVVKLRFLAGMTDQQAAGQLGVSPRKANMLWSYARAWLQRDMENREAYPSRSKRLFSFAGFLCAVPPRLRAMERAAADCARLRRGWGVQNSVFRRTTAMAPTGSLEN